MGLDISYLISYYPLAHLKIISFIIAVKCETYKYTAVIYVTTLVILKNVVVGTAGLILEVILGQVAEKGAKWAAHTFLSTVTLYPVLMAVTVRSNCLFPCVLQCVSSLARHCYIPKFDMLVNMKYPPSGMIGYIPISFRALYTSSLLIRGSCMK